MALGSIAVPILVACGDPPRPIHTRQAGVALTPESEAVLRDWRSRGYTLTQEVWTPQFRAMLFAGEGRTAVRIVTKRGIAAALDAPSPFGRERLVSLRLLGDINDDEAVEMLVGIDGLSGERRCFGVISVYSEGHAVELRVQRALGEDPCVVGVGEEGELVAEVRWHSLSRGRSPRERLPLVVREGQLEVAPIGTLTRVLLPLARSLEQTAQDPSVESDVRYAAIVERVALARRMGGSTEVQLSKLRALRARSEWTDSESRSLRDLERFVQAEWVVSSDPNDSSEPSEELPP